MSIIKPFSVDESDMFYIQYDSNNFTNIDCCMNDEIKTDIIQETQTISLK